MKKNFVVGIALLTTVNIVFIDFCLIKDKISTTNGTNILQAIVSTLNLLFVFFLYFKDKYENKLNKENIVKQYWYHDVIISKKIDQIDLMYEKILSEIELEKPKNYDEVKRLLQNMKDPIKELRDQIDPLLFAFNKTFNKQIKEKLFELEDVATNTYMEIYKDPSIKYKFYEKVKEHQGELYSLMFKHDIGMF